MEKNQKVKFQLNPEVGFMDDGFEEGIAERVGLFQEFGYEIITTENGPLQQSIAIIEDVDSGKIYHVKPECLIICKN